MLKSKKMFSGAGYLLLIALAVGFPLMTSNTYYITLFLSGVYLHDRRVWPELHHRHDRPR